MLRIREPEDFGLGFNSMTRLYMDRYDEEILSDMVKLCGEYLKWFSYRTIICSLHDLIRQAIGKEKQRACHRELREIVSSIANDMGVINSRWGREKNFDRDTFYQWIIENGLTEEVTIKEVEGNEMLPLKKKYFPLFYKVCNYMIYYSYGRHTYMPSTCRSFVKANMEIMSDEALADIVEYLKKRNANIPKEESAIDKKDSDNWIYMQEDLEAELLTRQMFYLTQEKAGNNHELKKLLNELLDLNSLRTQKDCLYMYHQVMGIERYLLAISDDVNAKSLLKQVEMAKKAIGEKRVEFFEKEEGHLYEKIGEGIYQRR